jgi:L-threonylcarbamoyladenylate synthase
MIAAPAPLWTVGDPLAPLAALLAAGGVIAIPTESSYGLAVRPDSEVGVATIYRIKERERGKALPVVIGGLDQLDGLGIDRDLPILRRLAAFWPGPLTAVLPLRRRAGIAAAAGGSTLAVRIPSHPRLLALLVGLGHGLTATSANRSGEEPLLDPARVAELLAGEAAMVVDGGVLPGGPPSTLVRLVSTEPDRMSSRAYGGRHEDGRDEHQDYEEDGDGSGCAVEILRLGSLPLERLRAHVRVVD